VSDFLHRAVSIYKEQGAGALLRRSTRKASVYLVECLKRPFTYDTTDDPYHLNFMYFVEQVNRRPSPGRILEIGARNVSCRTYKKHFLQWEEYVGFDIHPGENVDRVGDIHRLSKYLPGEYFDFVFSISVFEHLAMPWKAVLEINKVMKLGGLLFISTHPVWPPHELPWDFWRCFEGTFPIILNPLTGFEILRCNEGLPCSVVPLANEPSMVGLWMLRANLGVSVIARKIGAPDPRLSWDIELEEFVSSVYPTSKPKDAEDRTNKIGILK